VGLAWGQCGGNVGMCRNQSRRSISAGASASSPHERGNIDSEAAQIVGLENSVGACIDRACSNDSPVDVLDRPCVEDALAIAAGRPAFGRRLLNENAPRQEQIELTPEVRFREPAPYSSRLARLTLLQEQLDQARAHGTARFGAAAP